MAGLRVLLHCDVFSEGTTSLFVAKALNNLGHSVVFSNANLKHPSIPEDYDVAIVWTNYPPPRNLFAKPVGYVYLDDPEYWKEHNPALLPEVTAKDYEHVFVNMKWKGMDSRYVWLPMGCLPRDVHAYVNMDDEEKKRFSSDIVFIGTNRGKRPELITHFAKNLSKKYSFSLFGNGWNDIPGLTINTKPMYYYNFSKIISNSRIVLTEHWKNAFSTNDCEKPAIGGALMITDNEIVKEVYPMCPMYHSYEEAIELCHYYLEHEEERRILVAQMQKIAIENFSYEVQLKKILDTLLQ